MQQTLWQWAQVSAEHNEEVIEPHVEGKLTLNELPPARPELMFERIRRARELHLALERELGEVNLVITDNRRRMVSAKRKRRTHELRLHHMFLDARPDVVSTLAAFAGGDTAARKTLQSFIKAQRDAIRHEVNHDQLNTLGKFHDLAWILEGVRAFIGPEGLEDIHITWGRHGRGKRSIRFGSFDFEQRLIRIHPALDKRWVPTYFLEYIVYHELLHALYPPTVDDSGRRCVHTDEFMAMERRFPRYDDAIAWERKHIRRLLGS